MDANDSSDVTTNVSSTRSYVVQPGDNLTTIAHREYGAASKWKAIFDANRDVLKDPDHLPMGVAIVLPDL